MNDVYWITCNDKNSSNMALRVYLIGRVYGRETDEATARTVATSEDSR